MAQFADRIKREMERRARHEIKLKRATETQIREIVAKRQTADHEPDLRAL